MTLLNSVHQLWREVAQGWREFLQFDPFLESRSCSDDVEEGPRDAEARERERIELAIMTAHFHF